MKISIQRENIETFLNRFYDFADSIVHSLTLHFTKDGARQFELTLATRDTMATQDNGWVCVKLTIGDVIELSIIQQKTFSIQVLSFGLYALVFENNFVMDLDSANDEPSNLDELRKSNAYVIGKSLTFEVKELSYCNS